MHESITKILVRFDDICPTMDYQQWARALEILEKYDIKPLLGVVPDCQDPVLQIDAPHDDFWQEMRALKEKGYAIAQHGYRHVYHQTDKKSLFTRGNQSEFTGLPYEEQLKMLREGKRILAEHGLETDVFFAPSHSYDQNTLRALSECGFQYISDGKSAKAMERSGLICLPCRSSGCPKIRKNKYYTAVFHAHEWVRPDKAHDYDSLKQLCENHHENIVSFEDYKQQPIGNSVWQAMTEKEFMAWDYWVKPTIRPALRLMRKVCKK